MLLSTRVALLSVEGKELLELFHNLKESDRCIEFDTDKYHYVFESPNTTIELYTLASGVLDLSGLTLMSKEELYARSSSRSAK